MLVCKLIDTPMDPNVKLGETKGGSHLDKGRYQHLVRKLIYLSHKIPDITFSVSCVSQFMQSLLKEHMDVVYRILRYLKGTSGKGLFFRKTEEKGVKIFYDAD